MQTINLQINIEEGKPEPVKPAKSYAFGYELGKLFRQQKIEKKVATLLQKDWNKDYSDLDYPTVFRKERKNA